MGDIQDFYRRRPPAKPGLRDWTLVSRTRYALVWTGVNLVVVFGILVVTGALSFRSASLLAIPALLVGFLINGWIWYPLAERKLRAGRG
jgi:hypothetical protein